MRFESLLRIAAPLLSVLLALTNLTAQAADPLFKMEESRERIREEILKSTPMGCAPEKVIEYLKKQTPEKTPTDPRIEDHPATGSAVQKSGRQGVRSIRVVVGEYFASSALLLMDVPLPIKLQVVVQWAFDKENRLIEVSVEKKPVASP